MTNTTLQTQKPVIRKSENQKSEIRNQKREDSNWHTNNNYN